MRIVSIIYLLLFLKILIADDKTKAYQRMKHYENDLDYMGVTAISA